MSRLKPYVFYLTIAFSLFGLTACDKLDTFLKPQLKSEQTIPLEKAAISPMKEPQLDNKKEPALDQESENANEVALRVQAELAKEEEAKAQIEKKKAQIYGQAQIKAMTERIELIDRQIESATESHVEKVTTLKNRAFSSNQEALNFQMATYEKRVKALRDEKAALQSRVRALKKKLQ